MDVNRELISRYADAQVSAEERKLAEAQLRDDPQASLDLDDYQLIEELFGHIEPESVSDECIERLYAIDGAYAAANAPGSSSGADSAEIAKLPAFEAIQVAPVRRIRWVGWAAAAAAVFLAAVGITQLTYKPEVRLQEFARLSLDATGALVKTERLASLTLRTGAELVTGPRERITYRDELGARVVLMPESRLELGDPRNGEIIELLSGTVLLTVRDSDEERLVSAGEYTVRSHGADFAVRVKPGVDRAAGATLSSTGSAHGPQLTVAVRVGRCEVGTNGDRQPVEALWRVVLRRGAPAERSRIWEGPLFRNLMQARGATGAGGLMGPGWLTGPGGREILPGFFSGEAGVRAIRLHGWRRVSASEHELVISDNQAASVASWLVFESVLDSPTRLELVMVRPISVEGGSVEGGSLEGGGQGSPEDGARYAVETVVTTPYVPQGRHVVAIPLESFQGPEARKQKIQIPASRSRLVRLRLRSVDKDRQFGLERSLWSARPPASNSEVIR